MNRTSRFLGSDATAPNSDGRRKGSAFDFLRGGGAVPPGNPDIRLSWFRGPSQKSVHSLFIKHAFLWRGGGVKPIPPSLSRTRTRKREIGCVTHPSARVYRGVQHNEVWWYAVLPHVRDKPQRRPRVESPRASRDGRREALLVRAETRREKKKRAQQVDKGPDRLADRCGREVLRIPFSCKLVDD